MVNAVTSATHNLSEADAIEIVRREQERTGWRGVIKRGGNHGE